MADDSIFLSVVAGMAGDSIFLSVVLRPHWKRNQFSCPMDERDYFSVGVAVTLTLAFLSSFPTEVLIFVYSLISRAFSAILVD